MLVLESFQAMRHESSNGINPMEEAAVNSNVSQSVFGTVMPYPYTELLWDPPT